MVQTPENKDDIDLDGWDFHRAAEENRVDIARALIDRGTDVDARNDNGDTPLHWATMNNSLDVARLLIEHGAEIDARSSTPGFTPLHIAASNNYINLARLLIEHGAITDGIDLRWTDDQEDA